MINLFIPLLLAHLLGDFVFQSNAWVLSKQKLKLKSPFLYLHVLLHFLLSFLLLKFNLKYLLGIGIITISHLFIDALKLYLVGKFNERLLFLFDQLLHILIIFIVSAFYLNFNFYFVYGEMNYLSTQILLFIIALIALSSVSAIIMRLIMDYWVLDDFNPKDSLKFAGKYIGIIERILIFIFVLLNQWAAIGFLVTAKSVFRFSDLSRAKDRKLTEYILIGTLLSFSLAIIIGLSFNFLTQFVSS